MRATQNKEQFWLNHAAGADSYSGSHEAYCRAEGISAPALRYWRKKVRRASQSKCVMVAPKFIPVEITQDQQTRVGLPDPRWLAELIIQLSGGAR